MDVREKFVELLLGRKEVVSEICENTSCKTCQYEKYGFNCDNAILADHLIAHGVMVQKWIPVTERLPEEWVYVLVLSKYGFCEVAVYLGIPGKWRIAWNHDLFELDSVTHWMPLPEPPKGE